MGQKTGRGRLRVGKGGEMKVRGTKKLKIFKDKGKETNASMSNVVRRDGVRFG